MATINKVWQPEDGKAGNTGYDSETQYNLDQTPMNLFEDLIGQPFAIPQKTIYEVELIDLLPPSIKYDLDVQALAAAISPEILDITNSIQECNLLSRIDELPAEVLDLLAWQYHVDFYDPSAEIETKRELVKNSLKWHQIKGTPAAVEELISTVFGDGKVEEWFEYGGDPYYFRVITNDISVTQEKAVDFMRALESVKNTRSKLDQIIVSTSDELDLYMGGVVHIGDKMTVEQVV